MDRMNRNRKLASRRLVISLILVALIVAGVWFLPNFISKVPKWQDLTLDHVHLSGVDADFTVSNGKIYKNGKVISKLTDGTEYERVLKLVLFYQWEKEDPILASSSTNIEKIDPILSQLEEQDNRLIQGSLKKFPLANNPLEYPNPVQFQLHPFAFLRAFEAASKQYSIFSKDVSEDNANNLDKALQQAAESYLADANTIENGFSQSIGGNEQQEFIYLGGETVTTGAIFKDDLEKIKNNGQLLLDEAKKRNDCLQSSKNCIRPLENFVPSKDKTEEHSAAPTMLTLQQLNIQDKNQVSGPYLVNSRCWNGKEQAYLYYSTRCSNANGCIDWSYLADNMYFAQFAPKTDFGKAMSQAGVQYVMQNSSVPYGCNDLVYKQNLAMIDYEFSTYKDKRIFQNISQSLNWHNSSQLKEAARQGIEKENQFFDATYPSQDSLDVLSQQYALTYSLASRENALNSSQRDELLKRYLEIKQKYVSFDNVLNRVLYHEKNFANENADNENTIPMRYLYSARSNYSLFFLNFSDVWLNSQQPEYLQNRINKDEIFQGQQSPIIDLEQGLTLFDSQKLQEWTKISEDYRRKQFD